MTPSTSSSPPPTSSVAVIGTGAFVPGYEGIQGWASATRDKRGESDLPKAALVPTRQRRRASILSKAFADAYAEALAISDVDASQVASVFGSALGEAGTMIGLLDQMWSAVATLSPMKFATSVHNAASGIISIATENRGFTTSLGADFDTPAMALFEGMGLVLAENRPVIICCGDEAPPKELAPEGAEWSLLAAAIALAPVGQAPEAPRLSDLRIASATLAPPSHGNTSPGTPSLHAALERNPNMGLLDLVTTLSRGKTGTLCLDRGAGRGFSVVIESP